MHFIYKQDFYRDKPKKIDDLFIEYLAHIMDDLDHIALIEEWQQNLDAADYENNLNQDIKIQSMKKKLILMIKLNTVQQA